MKERYGVQDPKAQHFRFGVVCGGSSLVAPQPYNNVVRVAVETMAAVLGGAQSIFTCAFDEAFQIPTETSAELAVRTQQIIAYESGIARTVDPLGGSYFLEQHTDRMEEAISKVMDEIDDYGGVVRAIEDGWIQMRLAERGLRAQAQDRFRRSGHRRPEPLPPRGRARSPSARCSSSIRRSPGARWKNSSACSIRAARRTSTSRWRGLQKPRATTGENLMPYLVDCCHAYATVGEMVATLKKEWGEFKEPVKL